MPDFFLLFSIGIIQFILFILIGLVMPLYVVAMQILFPSLSLGNIIALNKCTTMAGSIGAIKSFWKNIDWNFLKKNAPFFFLGSVLGSFMISALSNAWVVVLLAFAFFLAEYAEKISKRLPQKFIKILELGMGMLDFLVLVLLPRSPLFFG